MAQATNSSFDALAAAVPGPYGPLVRVTDIDTDMDFNDNRDAKVVVTSDLDVEFGISFNELNTAAVRQAILDQVHSGRGINGWINDLLVIIDALDRYAATLSLPHTDAEAVTFINALRTFMPLVANPPNIRGAWRGETSPTISQAISGTGASRTATLTVTDADFVFTDWGDGSVDVSSGPNSNSYALDGVYTIRSVAIGRGGIAFVEDAVTVDVP